MKPKDIESRVKLVGMVTKVWPYLKLLLKELRSYESRVEELAKDVNKLRKEGKKVQNKVKEEENRHGRAIDDTVIKWLNEVDGVICKYENYLKDEDRSYAVFSDGYLPKPAIRYRLSVIVVDITKKVNVLLKTAKHDYFSYWLGPPSFDADFDNIRYESFASRNQIMADITAKLADSNVGVIGVYGWSGVGKTSLIKEVAKKVKGEMFDEVIMVNVTSRPNIRSIQGQIADNLGMKLEEESESGRAARLRQRLKNPKEKTLMILDNVGVKLDFNMLGIPFESSYAVKIEEFDRSSLMKIQEPLASYKGCKILMISDSEQLLLSQMNGKAIQTFCVKPLTEKEAESMFKTMAEIGVENSMFETLAAQIANMCKGLPMTIVTTANALKNKSFLVWEDAYRRLERQNSTAVPELTTKLSYDLLENEELQHTFLLCARMGHDALITDLVRNCIGLGLLQEIYSVREARDRVHALVGKLKELSLLSDSFSTDRFTMQDMIRDAALSIASQRMHAFALTKGKLDEWPDMDKLERYTAISLQHCDITGIMKELPESINCSRLRVFHLDNKDPLLEIPDNFFNGMKELRVLILIGIHLSSLPSSIKCLKKLRMLCLERCKLGKHLSIIGELEKLKVLSLSGSDVDKLPVELGQLAKLQIFDISDCFKLKWIPADVLSSLTGLEELYMENSPIQWIDKGQGNASLSELRQLDQLRTLDIQIPKITHFPKNLFFDMLDSYRIIISDFNAYRVWDFKKLEKCEASRNLALQLEEGLNIHHQKEIKILFGRVENLLLGQLNDVEDIFYELNYEGFPYLKYLSIVSNSKVKSIINSKNPKHPEKAYTKLESLFLYEVNKMEHICYGQLTNDSFCKLKIIKLKICDQLKNVFFSSMIKHFAALERIEVSECNTLKEIVTLEAQSSRDQIIFPELRSLALQSLSEFIGFYTDDASTGEQMQNRKPNRLFDEKVVVSKLEKMELCSIKIQKIWNDQPLTRSYFQNLMHLDVNDCWNMPYLLSLSMCKSLMNLQSLFVSECGKMENIFVETEFIEFEESIFPKLNIINLRSMRKLRNIWHPKFPSIGKLDALIIEGCSKLENVFPCYMVGKFKSLYNLKVTNCKSMKAIFDLRGCGKRDAEYISNLKIFHVEALPELEHVWKIDQEGILNFKNLKKILIQECLNLKYIFPVFIATGLKKLEYLEVWNCGQLKEIVSRGNANNSRDVVFEFPKLTTARFSKLRNLESFYGETHEIRCSALNNLSVELCHKLKLFGTETVNQEIKSVFFPEEVIYNLKSMQIEPGNAKWLMTYMGNYRMHKLEEFQLSRLVDTKLLYFFLHRNPNLKSLLLSNCFFEQLVTLRSFTEDNSGVVPRLRSLKLISLPSLKMIGFEEDTILYQRLECLILKECPCLNTIAPSSISFTCLTNLEVSNCNVLSYLITPSIARSLVKLTSMKVIQCKSMKTIVSQQENEEGMISEDLNMKKLRITFKQLKEIELVDLRKLESFSSSFYSFDFPSLEKFVVGACGSMKSFTLSGEDNKTPILRQICVRHGKEDKACYWKGDLNATIQYMYTIWAIDPSIMAASHPYKPLESSQLKTLKLANCKLESHAIPTVVFPSLKNLQELEVSLTNVKLIFGVMETKMKGYTFPLKKLTLHALPNLTQVWDFDWHWNYEEIPSFQNLQEVSVINCQKLKTLFPIELAKKVEKLKKLEIRYCEEFLNVVEKKNATIEATEEFSFPRLTSLDLHMLPKLTGFYPGTYTLECPELNHLEVLFCGNLEVFQRQQSSTSVIRQTLFSEEKATFSLESLKLDWKNTMMLLNGRYPEEVLHKLVELELDFDEANEVSNFPLVLIEKASSLEYLRVTRSRRHDKLFPSQPGQDEIVTHGCLNPVSFSNLKQLSVQDCHGLKHLFTPSTAKRLVHLEEMYIVRCESMEEILAMEQEETTSEAIKFERLHVIILDSLSSLSCFYPGSYTLLLSSLIKVLIRKCPNMKIFSQGVVDAESFSGIQGSLDSNEDLLLHQDLNASVEGMFQRQEFFEALDKKCFSDNLEQQACWHGKFDHQNKWLINLVTLKLSKCTLKCAIPSGIFPHLNNLQELEVRDNDKVEVIFDMNDNEILRTTSQLKILTIKGLSKLTHVCGKNSQRLLIFPYLQQVVVRECENLQALFPTSLAKNLVELEKLEIKSCAKLQEIVQKEEHTAAILKFVFPRLEKFALSNLPMLTCFYSQAFSVECPALNKLFVLNCDKLELFQSAHPSRESEDMPVISDLKVISNLKELRLDWKHISALNLRFKSEQFVEVFKYLNEISLSFGTYENVKTMLPVEMLQKTPNLREMTINTCNSLNIFIKIAVDGMLGQLKILTLREVSQLQYMESEDSSWLNTICEKLNQLYVYECPHLTTLVRTVSFSCLKKVFISDCPQLQHLFTSSAARKLTNLEEIIVEDCESLKEIVANNEGNETSEAIIFKRLNTIVLLSLSSLVCFYSGSDTLQLSSLTEVCIRQCPNMKIFSQGLVEAESFRGIQMWWYSNEDLFFHQDLNATIKGLFQRQEFFEALKKECFSNNLELPPDRHYKFDLQNKWLCNLVTLKLNKCTLRCAIPSAILPHLNNLEVLEVQDNDKVEVIFYMNDTEILKTTSRLKILTLKGLSELRHVCEKNNQGVLIFPHLQQVVVRGCKNLQTLFPGSLAKNLKELEKLEIESCDKLQEIVEKEGKTANVTEEFLFPRLENLVLLNLPQLTCFYPQTFTLECPALNKLLVLNCHKLELFQSEGEGMGTSINRLPLISNLKVISNLKELTLQWKHISALNLRFKSEQFVEGLKYLNEFFLFVDTDENEKVMLPIEILQEAPNLREMGIQSCKSPEIFLAENPKDGEDGMLGQLKILKLLYVSMLQSIVSEASSWLNKICEKIHELNLKRCPDLTILVHYTSTVSFSCLKKVSISNCPNLQYLFTSSAARKLMNLEEITIKECESMKGIVDKEGDEDEHKGEGEDNNENEMKFSKFEILKLDSLPKFENFYMGSSTLNFPSLKEVCFTQCYSTKIFRLGDKVPETFRVTIEGTRCKSDINSVIMSQEDAA